MLITSFQAKGYRSLYDVELRGLGAFNVFYGRNGSGKSNLLEAMRLLFGVLKQIPPSYADAERGGFAFALRPGALRSSDFQRGGLRRQMVLTATLPRLVAAAPDAEPQTTRAPGPVRVEVVLTAVDREPLPAVRATLTAAAEDGTPRQLDRALAESLQRTGQAWFLVPAVRAMTRENQPGPGSPLPDALPVQELPELLERGKLKEAMFRALTHQQPEVRQALRRFQALLQGPPLHRPPSDPVFDPHTGEFDLQEQDPVTGAARPVDQEGLGVQQLYTTLAGVLLSGAAAVGLEEPEAHLHAPSTGIALRQLLDRVVVEGHIQQLFLATHSNLFDLDSSGFWEVTHDPRTGTRVVRQSDLARIDAEHLYEPGPARRALLAMLGVLEPQESVFRRADGTRITHQEMIRMLREDDPVAVDFLRGLHGALDPGVGPRHPPHRAAPAGAGAVYGGQRADGPGHLRQAHPHAGGEGAL